MKKQCCPRRLLHLLENIIQFPWLVDHKDFKHLQPEGFSVEIIIFCTLLCTSQWSSSINYLCKKLQLQRKAGRVSLFFWNVLSLKNLPEPGNVKYFFLLSGNCWMVRMYMLTNSQQSFNTASEWKSLVFWNSRRAKVEKLTEDASLVPPDAHRGFRIPEEISWHRVTFLSQKPSKWAAARRTVCLMQQLVLSTSPWVSWD